jgi:hypothetical protein
MVNPEERPFREDHSINPTPNFLLINDCRTQEEKKASIIANKRVASNGLGTDSPPLPHNFSIVSYTQHVFSSVAVALASLQHQSINPLFLIESGCGHSSALREVSRSGQQRNFFLLIFDVAASGSRQSTDGALFVAFNGWHTASVCLRNAAV